MPAPWRLCRSTLQGAWVRTLLCCSLFAVRTPRAACYLCVLCQSWPGSIGTHTRNPALLQQLGGARRKCQSRHDWTHAPICARACAPSCRMRATQIGKKALVSTHKYWLASTSHSLATATITTLRTYFITTTAGDPHLRFALAGEPTLSAAAQIPCLLPSTRHAHHVVTPAKCIGVPVGASHAR